MIDKKNLKTKIDSIDLDTKNSQELLSILYKSFTLRTLAGRKGNKILGDFQKEIAKTLWIKFPEVAKEEGLKKVRVA
jgi:uncharacterized lipoprotein YehR (DUF1307 family)